MITGTLKNNIDRLWESFWTGGITNPLTVIEQISYLMFMRLLDMRETREERKANRTGQMEMLRQDRTRSIFADDKQHLRWQNVKQLGGEEMLTVIRDEVFPHFKKVAGEATTFGRYIESAQFMIQTPNLLVQAVEQVDALPLNDADTKGDLYEYLLSKLTTAGINGQFRTPRHIIELMVRMLKIEPTETVCDPACGTGGFLVGVMQEMMKAYTSEEGKIEVDGETIYTGDLLEPFREHVQSHMLNGFDFDSTMLRIGSMNLMLHGVDNPAIHYQNTLATNFKERHTGLAENAYDVILANPPFKGSLDYEEVSPDLLQKTRSKKTEILFITLILRLLKMGGRAAVIVPDGVLFGSTNAHKALRTMLIEEHQLEAVISLPSGVFKPYAGVSTAIIFFAKGGVTEDVWFYEVEADGYSLDDKRDEVDENDLPDVLSKWMARDASQDSDRTAKHFFVPKKDIEDNAYDLSINRYKEIVYEEEEYEAPTVILAKLRALESEIMEGMDELEEML
jgi:type I restriction enzyme M protein